MGEVTDQQLIDQVDRPEDIMDDQQDYRVVVMPADHKGINTQNAVDDAGVPVVHTSNIRKRGRPQIKVDDLFSHNVR
jgi:hypothetical protein